MSKAITMPVSSSDLRELTTPKKRLKALHAALDGSVKLVLRAAAILHLMVEEGDDVAMLSTTTREWLLRVQSKQILPEVYLEFRGMLRKRIAGLTRADQQKIVDGTLVKTVVKRPHRKEEVLELDPRRFSTEQIKQVFDHRGKTRSVAEQKAYLASNARRRQSNKNQAGRYQDDVDRVLIDLKRKGVFIGRDFYPAETVKGWVEQLAEGSE